MIPRMCLDRQQLATLRLAMEERVGLLVEDIDQQNVCR